MSTATSAEPAAQPSHHHRARYAAAGNDTVANLATALHPPDGAPLTTARDLASRLDNLAARAGSRPADCSADSSVAVRWYSRMNSSISAPVSFLRRFVSASSLDQSAPCSAAKTSRSTAGDYNPVSG